MRLIWLCLVPLMLLATYLTVDHVRILYAQADAEAANLTKNTATAIDHYLNARISALKLLARSPLLDNPARWEELYRQAQAYGESFGAHVVFAEAGEPIRVLFNTRQAFGAPLPPLPGPERHAAAPAAVATGKPAVGDIFLGPIAREPLVAIAVPAMRNGKAAYLMLATFETRHFQQRLAEEVLPDGWDLSLLDGGGSIIARRAPAGPDTPRDVNPSGHWVVRSEASPWSVMLEIPRNVHRAPRVAAATALGAGLVGATLLGVLGGMLAGRRLSAAVARLAEAPPTQVPALEIAEIAAVRRLLDETAEKRTAAEVALAEREAQHRAVVETAADGFWMLDGQGRILAVNDAYVKRSGYSREELLTMHIALLEALESDEEILAHIEKVRRSGSDLFETRHRTRTGEMWPVEVNASYWAAAGGRFFCFLRDITERKRAEAALEALHVETEQLMKRHVASQTAAAIAHELNQPLIAVATYAEAALRLLRAGNPQPDKLRQAIEGSAQQAQRAGHVVRELLAFIKVNEVQTEPVDLNDLVRRVLATIRANIREEFETRLELGPDLPKVNANRVQIEKVLANLVQNGIEAMREGGVTPRSVSVTVCTSGEGGMAQVKVRDSGPGVDAQSVHRVFDPFFTTKAGGLGVGLSISRTIVEAHGGQLWLEMDSGPGATFHFTLPFVT